MPPVARIIDQTHEKKDHWVFISRRGVTSVYGVILDGHGASDPEGRILDPAILGPTYSCRDYNLDLRSSSFTCFPVKVYGATTAANPAGEYEIPTLTGDAVAVTANLRSGPSGLSAPSRGGRVPKAPVSVGTEGIPAINGNSGSSTAVIAPPKVVRPKISASPPPLSSEIRCGADGVPITTVDQIPVFLDSLEVEQSVMIWGKPGIGKSAGVQQFASQRNLKIYEVRLNQIDPTSLQGIGVADMVAGKCVWLPAEFIPDQPNSLLFLDELTSAPQTIQTLAYQITLDRAIGSRRLPPDCRVICAGNRVTDRGVAFTPPSALANRLFHLTIEPDISAWRKWAYTAGIDSRLIAFLSVKPDLLHVLDAVRCGGAWPSPRSWASVSRVLGSKLSPANMGIGISACVGGPEAKEFIKFCKDYNNYLKIINDILDGVNPTKINDPPSAIAISVAVAANATQDEETLRNALIWGNKQDEEFRAILVHGLENRFGEEKLFDIPEYADFAKGQDTDFLKI